MEIVGFLWLLMIVTGTGYLVVYLVRGVRAVRNRRTRRSPEG